ncbi:MAG: hypothetical protein ACREGJ_01185 [Candidatus Saccharimonadales bacterium]
MKDSGIDLSVYDDLSVEVIEALRHVLEEEQGKSFTFEEAKEVGVGLLKLFEVLADGENDKQERVEEEVQPSISSGQLSLIY